MKSTSPLAVLCILLVGSNLQAAPTLQQDPFGTNKPLVTFLSNQQQFQSLPWSKDTMCHVISNNESLARYVHVAIDKGIVGTIIADYTKFENDKLIGEPYMQSGTFGGMILLRGTSSPSSSLTYKGDPMFPLVDGNSFKITLQRSNSRLEYSCEDHYAPKRFKIAGLSEPLHLVSCMRSTILANDVVTEKPSYALCSPELGLCPLHWVDADGYKNLFDYYEVGGQRFSPVQWHCEAEADWFE